jgi:hypothetical protein
MWVPPPWLIYAAVTGAGQLNASRSRTALAQGQTAKVVSCEKCQRRYAYELWRSGYNAEHLKQLLATEFEAIPCPACGWYQSNMIPKVRKRHRRWMIHVGQCLTVGLITVMLISLLINGYPEFQGDPRIPWPIFVAVLVCLFAVGIGLIIWRSKLAQSSDPNAEDVEARKSYGRSRTIFMSEHEAKAPEAPPAPVSALYQPPGTGTMSNDHKKEPAGSEPQAGEALAGCGLLLLLIIGGILYWNHLRAEMENEANEKVRQLYRNNTVNPAVNPRDFEDMRRRNEEIGRVLEAVEQAQRSSK